MIKYVEVYRIDSLEAKKMVFIAAWVDAEEDWNSQLSLLRKNEHPVILLQNHFNKYGESDLKMTIVKKSISEGKIVKVIQECKEPIKEETISEVVFIPKIETAVMPEPMAEKAVIKEPKKMVKKVVGKKK